MDDERTEFADVPQIDTRRRSGGHHDCRTMDKLNWLTMIGAVCLVCCVSCVVMLGAWEIRYQRMRGRIEAYSDAVEQDALRLQRMADELRDSVR